MPKVKQDKGKNDKPKLMNRMKTKPKLKEAKKNYGWIESNESYQNGAKK